MSINIYLLNFDSITLYHKPIRICSTISDHSNSPPRPSEWLAPESPWWLAYFAHRRAQAYISGAESRCQTREQQKSRANEAAPLPPGSQSAFFFRGDVLGTWGGAGGIQWHRTFSGYVQISFRVNITLCWLVHPTLTRNKKVKEIC